MLEMSSISEKIGTLKAGTSQKFDEINGLILTIPVCYGRKNIIDDAMHVADDISIMKKRYIFSIKHITHTAIITGITCP